MKVLKNVYYILNNFFQILKHPRPMKLFAFLLRLETKKKKIH